MFLNVSIILLMQIAVWLGGPMSESHAIARATDRPVKIVAFGTSLTAGRGWPEHLEHALAECLGRPVQVARVAKPGATSDWGVGQIDRVVSEAPDVVLVEFYMNDAALHRFVSPQRTRTNMQEIVARLRQHDPQIRILLMGMNPVHGIRGLIRPFLGNYIDTHRTIAAEAGAEFVDHEAAWLRLSEAELAAAIPDGLHPSAEAAAAIMVPELARRIAGRPCPVADAPADPHLRKPL